MVVGVNISLDIFSRISFLCHRITRTSFSGVTATIKPGALGKTKPAINKALAEKGWVSQLKPTAHNYHLKNLQTASEAATEVSLLLHLYCASPVFVRVIDKTGSFVPIFIRPA
jgi:hypothetical protein